MPQPHGLPEETLISYSHLSSVTVLYMKIPRRIKQRSVMALWGYTVYNI